MTVYARILLLVVSMTLSTPAYADAYCGSDAPPQRLLTYRDGSVLVRTAWRDDFIAICNLTTTWKGVAPNACFAWMSKIAGAISANKKVRFYYEGSNLTDSYCASVPTYWQAPAPLYIDVTP